MNLLCTGVFIFMDFTTVYLNESLEPLEGEVWLPVKGFEEYFKISSYGRLLNMGREFYAGWRGEQKMVLKKRIVLSYINPTGYIVSSMTKNGVETKKDIHVLVAEHFLPPPPNDGNEYIVDHISMIKTQNNVGNLEWVTRSENTVRAHEKGVLGNWWPAKFNKEQVLHIFNDIRTIDEIAKEYNVHRSTIHLIKTGKNYSRYTGKKFERVGVRRVTHEEVMLIFNSTEHWKVVCAKFNIGGHIYRTIKTGKSHSSITGKIYSPRKSKKK